MTWLSIVNWPKYQDIRVDDPHYIKLHLCILDDKKIQGLPPLPRLLWYQLLPLAGRYGNAIPHNISAIAKETRLERHTVAKSLQALIDLKLVSVTKTPRRGGKPPKVTGWRFVRGSHGGTFIQDPEGTDYPNWWRR